jgi:site-specific DNA-methyltransferase (adenine-specific)
MNKELMFSSKNQEWETPADLFKMLDMEFNFIWDLAASITNSKCKNYIGKVGIKTNFTTGVKSEVRENSLTVDWGSITDGYLWLNPPYGRGIIDWVKKCDEEAQKGANIVALLPARTDTLWFHNHIYRKYETRFLKGRIKFLMDGVQQDAAPFPSMIVVFEKK